MQIIINKGFHFEVTCMYMYYVYKAKLISAIGKHFSLFQCEITIKQYIKHTLLTCISITYRC